MSEQHLEVVDLMNENARLREQLDKARVALEKISGRKEFDIEDMQLCASYKRSEGMWTMEEYIADVTLSSLTDEDRRGDAPLKTAQGKQE